MMKKLCYATLLSMLFVAKAVAQCTTATCLPPLPPTHAADGVRLNYCDSDQSLIYQRLYGFMLPNVTEIQTLLTNTVDQPSYALLLAECNSLVSAYNSAFGVTSGRIVVVDSDGLVIVDTSKGALNTFANAEDGANPATFASAINVNHNSRLAILDAQQFDNGVGVETKLSNSTNTIQSYVAIRLGLILNNVGTFRMSQNFPGP
jgi:hypothetical protein